MQGSRRDLATPFDASAASVFPPEGAGAMPAAPAAPKARARTRLSIAASYRSFGSAPVRASLASGAGAALQARIQAELLGGK
jgi:hypothetical protein